MLIEKVLTKKKIVIFRVDLSEKIGLGHYMRCYNLASLIYNKKILIVFVFNFDSYRSFIKLRLYTDFKFKIFIIDHKLDETIQINKKLLSNLNADMMIIDKYDWDILEEKKCREFSKKIVVFDDLANRKHDCDFLVDVSLERKVSDYSKLIPKKCNLFLGPEYAPLKESFHKLRKKVSTRKRKYIKKILLCFGGTDPHDLTSLTISSLEKFNNIDEVSIVLNRLSSNFDKIQKVVSSNKKYKLIADKIDLSNDFFSADLCVGACGFSSWERCYLGLPSLVIVTAENQRFISKKLSSTNSILLCSDYKNVTQKKIIKCLEDIIHSNNLADMSKSSLDIFTSLRIDKILLDEIFK